MGENADGARVEERSERVVGEAREASEAESRAGGDK